MWYNGPTMIKNYENLQQELDADYRILKLTGDHQAIGHQLGLATPMREVETWRDRKTELAFARACAEVTGQIHPPLLDEYRGYAAAQSRDWDEVLPHFSLNLPEGTLSGCTTLARRLAGGDILVARNYDFLHSQQERYLRLVEPAGYPATLGTQAGLIGSCYDGVNNYGLFAALHLIRAQMAENVPPGVPFHLIPRILLEKCRTAQEAVELLEEMPHLFPFNYLVADPDEMFAVEVYPGQVHVRRPENNCLVTTNYYASPELRPLQGRRKLKVQVERVNWVKMRIAEDAGACAESSWAWAMHLLRDHSVPMCHHQPTQATLWAMVANLNARRIAYCLGAPCRNEFQEWEWPNLCPNPAR